MQDPTAPSSHRNISAWAIRNPIPVFVLFLLLTLAGMLAFPTLRINNTPDIDLPSVVISAAQPGAGPSEIEALVTRHIEDAVAGLADIRHITSTISDGISVTVVEFALGRNIDSAVNDIRDRLAEIRADLPATMRDPAVTHIEAIGGAILTYTVAASDGTSARSAKDLSRFVDDTITRTLLLVPGVAQIERVGGVDSEIRIALKPDRLLALGVTANDVNTQLRDLNLNLPGGRGSIGGVEQTIRTIGSVASVEQLRARTIALPGGRTARLADLADIADGTAEIRGAALLDASPVLAFNVMRTRTSSEVAVADQITAGIARIQAADPAIRIQLVASTVEFSRDGYHAAIEALLIGAALAVLVVWAFLPDWRATFVASIAIPLSLIPTFLVMKLLGFSLNNVTLLSLTLVIGVLVDDAIVEIENIVRHLRARPLQGAWRAALDGSAEIGFAVTATTAAILAVFVPVAFMPGIPGQFFRQFGLTVAAAVAFSLIVARMLTPLLGAYLLKPGRPHSRTSPLERWYIAVLRACLRHRLTTIGGGLLFFTASVALVPFIPHDFIAAADRDRSALSIELAPGSTLADTETVTRAATAILKSRPEVISVFAAIGTAGGGSVEGASMGSIRKAGDPHTATLTVKLTPRTERSLSQQQFEAAIRPALERLPGARVHFAADKRGGSRLQIALVGEDAATLAAAARDLERQMRTVAGLSGTRSTASLTRPELRIIPRDARAAERGVSVADIGLTARLATVGDVDQSLPRFDLPDRQIPIRVMLDERARANLDTLRSLQITGRNGLVPLDAVAELRYGAGPAQITHLDRMRKMTVEAELNAIPLGQAASAVADLPIMRALPAGVHDLEIGDKETMRETMNGFAIALGAGVLLVYLVLVLLFGGFIQPLTIMTALPLSLGGAMLALLLAQKSLGIAAIVGILMLMGIVAKNSILLIDSALAARATLGLSRTDAIIEAAQKRAKPIVMTTVAMCAGMLHVALGFGADTEFRSPMALVVIGGLITSTILSLVFVPAAYTYMDQFETWLAGSLRPIAPYPSDIAKSPHYPKATTVPTEEPNNETALWVSRYARL
jgi:hydrophobic/amphiphilic exporter-1 (mainly G- bacteria), HAE1 family